MNGIESKSLKICSVRPRSARHELEENAFLFERELESIVQQRAASCLVWYIRKSVKSRYLYYFWSIVSIVSPLLATILNFVNLEKPDCITILTVLFTLVATLSTSLLNLYNFYGKWRDYRDAAEMLKREWTKYEQLIEGLQDKDRDKRNKLNEEFLNLIEVYMEKTHKNWMKRFTNKKNSDKGQEINFDSPD